VKLGLGRLKYIAAGRDGQGKVCSGGERTLTFEPAGFRASLLLDSAVTLIANIASTPVQQLLADMPEHLLSDTEKASRAACSALPAHTRTGTCSANTRFQGEYGKARFGGAPNCSSSSPSRRRSARCWISASPWKRAN